jgi:CYTH domain-containing protein
MPVTRCFLLASSLARLIERERGGHRITEAYFSGNSSRSTYVRMEEESGSLVLVRQDSKAQVEEPAELPHSHAEALLNLAQGCAAYLRIPLSFDGGQAQVLRFTAPGPLDLVSVEFEGPESAENFEALRWFGPEVTEELSYQTRSLALAGIPEKVEVNVTDAALTSVLDTLDHRPVARPSRQQQAWLKQRAAS